MENLATEGAAIDITVLDNLTALYLQNHTKEHEAILQKFLEREDLYLFAPTILPSPCSVSTKFYYLLGLNSLVSKMWPVFPEEVKIELRQLILHFIALPYDSKSVAVFNKSYEILSNILKYDLGEVWPSFFDDFCTITSESPVNSFSFISFLADTIKNDSGNAITSNRASDMFMICTNELDKILGYIYSILEKEPTNGNLIKAALPLLANLITWPSSTKIVESPIFSLIMDNYIQDPNYQLDSCLVLMQFLSSGIPLDAGSEFVKIVEIIMITLKNISDDFSTFPFNIKSSFLTMFDKFLKQINSLFDLPESQELLHEAYQWVMQLTINPNEEDSSLILEKCYNICINSFNRHMFRGSSNSPTILDEFTPYLRRNIIATYPSPYTITEYIDDFDNSVHIFQSKLFSDNFYDRIHDCFIILAQADTEDTLQAIQERFNQYQELSIEELRSLAYAISATTGTLQEEMEGQFIVPMLSQFLQIAQEPNENIDSVEDGRYQICSSLIYLYSQYHTMLSRYPILIKTLLQLIIKFLIEGNFELRAVCIFSLKTLGQCCSRYLTTIQENEEQTYCALVLENLPMLFEALEPDNIIELFRAIAIMIRAQNSDQEKAQQLTQLFSVFDPIWTKIISTEFDPSSIETYNTVNLILMCHSNILLSLSGVYSTILEDLLPQFMFIFQAITESLPKAVENPDLLKAMQSTKSQILFILFKYSYFCFDQSTIIDSLIPLSFETVLSDYVNSPYEIKLSASLKYFTAIFNRCSGSSIDENIFNAFDAITTATIEILNEPTIDQFTNLKIDYYNLMGSIARQYTAVLVTKEPDYINHFIEILKVGTITPIPSICETCIQILMDLINMFKNTMNAEMFVAFCDQYSLPLVQLYFNILTDLTYKSVFNAIATAIENLFSLENFLPKRAEAFEMLCQMYPNVEPVTIKELIDEASTSTSFSFSRTKLRNFVLVNKVVMFNDPDLFKAEMEPLKEELGQPIKPPQQQQLYTLDQVFITDQLQKENVKPSQELIESLASLSIKH